MSATVAQSWIAINRYDLISVSSVNASTCCIATVTQNKHKSPCCVLQRLIISTAVTSDPEQTSCDTCSHQPAVAGVTGPAQSSSSGVESSLICSKQGSSTGGPQAKFGQPLSGRSGLLQQSEGECVTFNLFLHIYKYCTITKSCKSF